MWNNQETFCNITHGMYRLRTISIRGVSRNALYKCTILTYLLNKVLFRRLVWKNRQKSAKIVKL